MSQYIIPIFDEREIERSIGVPMASRLWNGSVSDRLGRPLRDLRISVTDRCNFRCTYCMPKEIFGPGYTFRPRSDLLSFEEIERLARQFVRLDVRKLRLTGGEPLLRRGLEDLVAMLAAIRTPDGDPVDLNLTTNGSLLGHKAAALKDAGLQRVTVSLDAIEDSVFQRMNDVDFRVRDVLAGIDAALAAGLWPVKVNMVIQRDVNEHQIMPMLDYFRGTGIILRFIEYMDVGNSNGWSRDSVVPSAAILKRISARCPLTPLDQTVAGETAQRWMLADGSAEIGVISSITEAFCGSCNRARLSMDGKLYLCLFASRGYDLRALLRGDSVNGIKPVDDTELQATIGEIWTRREDRYSAQRGQALQPREPERKIEMSYIGG